MKYNEVKIHTSSMGIEPLTGILSDLGIDSIVIQDAHDFEELMEKKHEYDWDYVAEQLRDEYEDGDTIITFYLEQTEEDERRLQSVKESVMKLRSKEMEGYFGGVKTVGKDGYEGDGNQLGRLYVESNLVDEGDWKDNWKQYFKPTKITDHIIVKPTWQEYDKKTEELVISIDPGMAFGTGTHETTALCIKLLEKYVSKGDTILDVGCGSGILSMAVALLGAGEVKGVEIDPVAVDVALENIQLNRLTDIISIEQGDLLKGVKITADIVVANLMANLVMLLAEDVACCMKKNGIYISSGILLEKQDEVISVIRQCGFEVIEILEEGDWCAIAARLK